MSKHKGGLRISIVGIGGGLILGGLLLISALRTQQLCQASIARLLNVWLARGDCRAPSHTGASAAYASKQSGQPPFFPSYKYAINSHPFDFLNLLSFSAMIATPHIP